MKSQLQLFKTMTGTNFDFFLFHPKYCNFDKLFKKVCIQNMVQILTGSIPKELGNMTSMYFLFLPENKLTGTYLYLRLNVHACRLLSDHQKRRAPVQNILMDEFLQVKFRVKYSTFHHLN